MQTVMVQQVPPIPPVPPISEVILQGPQILPPWMLIPPPVVALIFLAAIAAAAVVLYPLFSAIGRRIEGRTADPALQREVEELRERVRDLEAGQGRYVELEERLDFAERLLAQRREVEQLPRN